MYSLVASSPSCSECCACCRNVILSLQLGVLFKGPISRLHYMHLLLHFVYGTVMCRINSANILSKGICRIPCCCCCDPSKKMKYERLAPTTTYGGRRMSRASSETLVHHRRQRAWQWRIQCMFCWLRLRGEQQTAFADVAATLADAFSHFRGYVPSDIIAGIALYTLHHTNVSNIQVWTRLN